VCVRDKAGALIAGSMVHDNVILEHFPICVSVIATFAREIQVKGQVGKGNVHTRQQQALCGALLNELKISNW